MKTKRLVSLFSGYDSQLLALKYLGLNVESWKTCEWAVKSIQALKDLHFKDDNNNYSKDLNKEELIEYLVNKGISANYNEPMSREQIKRLGEDKLRVIYNNIKATHNLVNIQQVKGKDLEIIDADKYDYIMTYSFPCQDLSLAGKGLGMAKGSGTRSGMLWEVERILSEINRDGCNLPQVLLMENVPQVHGKKNKDNFDDWCKFLESLGYKNFWKDLNAKNFGIPQNRNRTFMVSLLNDYNFEFPQEQELKLKLKDVLEDNVDEKYYLSSKTIENINNWKSYRNPIKESKTINDSVIPCITAKSNTSNNASMLLLNESCSNLQREVCNKALEFMKPNDTIDYTYSNSRLEEMKNGYLKTKNSEDNNIMNTLTTNSENFGICVNDRDSVYTETEKQLFTEDGNIKRYINSDIVDKFEEGQMATTSFPNGYGHGSRVHNESVTLNTLDKPSIKKNLRIRKLTPREAFRLMGVKDEDFEKIAENQSNASLYHLAGDSIVVNVLMAIFGSIYNIDWSNKLPIK